MRMRYLVFSCLCVLLFVHPAHAWQNGPSGNAPTDEPSECANPPYATHDWIADHALALLPDEEKVWLLSHKTMYLLGTEAPDNSQIPDECGAPNNGYGDTGGGHSVEWNSSWSKMVKDRAARRAQQEYGKAIVAYQREEFSDAAYYLGAMAHYIGDVSQYGHVYPDERFHSPYESWVKRRTRSFEAGKLETFIKFDNKWSRRTPYTAVKRISKATGKGKGKILPAVEMDRLYPEKKEEGPYWESIGHSLNLGVNELADVLHTFFLNVVKEEE